MSLKITLDEIKDVKTMEDPLRTDITDRYTILPILFQDVYDLFLKHRNTHWLPEEVTFGEDLNDWDNTLSDNERNFLKQVIAFFASSDKVVSDNISKNFMNEVEMDEAKYFYNIQNSIENTHSITYSNMLFTYISDKIERKELLRAVSKIKCIGDKIRWAEKWMNIEQNEFAQLYSGTDIFTYRLVAFIIIEGVFFSGSFCSIYWMQSKNLLKMLSKANNFIARDEGLHTQFGQYLYIHYIKNKLTDDQIHTLLKEAVDIEIEFITKALPCSMIGMDAEKMEKYIKFVSNNLLKDMGHTPLYKDINKCPFDFMDQITLQNRTDFFTQAPTEYTKELIALDPDYDIEKYVQNLTF